MITESKASAREQIAALSRRDLAIELSYPISLIARAGTIAASIVTFFFIAKIVDPDKLGPYGDRYFEFVLVGLLVGNLTTLGLGSFSKTISDEQSSGTLEVLLAMPMRLATLFVGSLIVPLGFMVVETTIVMLFAIVVLGADFQLGGTLTAFLAVPPTLAFYAAVGAVSAAFVVLSKRGDPFTLLATRLSNFLAGALFPIAVMPGVLRALAKVLPPYYSLEVLRAGMLRGQGVHDVWQELTVLWVVAAASLPVGLWLFGRALRTARRTGTLGSY